MNYVTPKYEQKEIAYLCYKDQVVKCQIKEIIIHYTITEPKIVYFVRPFGITETIKVEKESDLVSTLDEAKQITIKRVKVVYTKEKLQKEYKDKIKAISDRYETLLKNYKSDVKKTIDAINEKTDEWYDNKEKEYQELVNKENSNESTPQV